MSSPRPPHNAVRSQRLARDWSQQELADRAGLSRAGVSAIETGRLAPSVIAAMALARALDSTVEQLFGTENRSPSTVAWGCPPAQSETRYWNARVGNQTFAYPIEADSPQLDWHDGVAEGGVLRDASPEVSQRTLVVAGCDPAAGLLAAEYARQFQFRLIVLRRSSRDALDLLAAGKVHAAGIHLGGKGRRSDNARVAQSRLGRACHLVRVAPLGRGPGHRPAAEIRHARRLASLRGPLGGT